MGQPDIADMDEEIVEDFASHHVRMGHARSKDLKKMLNISNDIVEQLGRQGVNATDIAFIMIEISKQMEKRKKVEAFDMAFA
jgi:negative regulator of replication initiation